MHLCMYCAFVQQKNKYIKESKENSQMLLMLHIDKYQNQSIISDWLQLQLLENHTDI